MSVLIISFSPRRDGNTELLLKEVGTGAVEAGAEVEFVRLQDLKIEPCRECDGCHTTGSCVVDDDTKGLYSKLLETDSLVIGAPIFFMGLPAHGKAFIDRCQPLWAKKHLLKEELVPADKRPARRGYFISVGATKYEHLFDGAIRVIKAFFAVLEIEYAGDLLLKSVDEKGEVLAHPDMLARAREIGTRAASCGPR